MTYDLPDPRAVKIARAALDTDPAVRDAFIEDQCQQDGRLRDAVMTLVRKAADIESAPTDSSATAEEPLVDAMIGAHLGPFRVIERIGRGGMGVVYRAERADGDVRQRVAIKLIRRGFDFDDVLARFRRERRILARLNHPGLARFIDGGVADDGRPWFALDHVDGQPLLRWCDNTRLDVKARVRLFLEVCAAVQYAHTQLVVHRDLKPGNILVGQDGMPRLLDFGIARLLSGEDPDEATLTVDGQFHAFTPEYAAPEQFGGAAGVSVDVYALGVVLYELVSGVLPYAIDRRNLAAAESTVREALPEPLDHAIARADGSSASSGRVDHAPSTDDNEAATDTRSTVRNRLDARNTSIRAYRATVRGDLERILNKALAKEPALRYGTVDAFAQDLRRWLDGVPVKASGQRMAYRFGRFVKRNRLAVGLGLVILVATVAGITGTLMQARQSWLESERANAVTNFLVSIFEHAIPGGVAGQMPDVRLLLENGAERARTEFPGQPVLQANMLTVIGRIQSELGRYDEALPLIDQALDVLEAAGQQHTAHYADALLVAASVYRQQQRLPEAETSLRQGLAILSTSDTEREVTFRGRLGVILVLTGHADSGLGELSKALAMQRRIDVPPGSGTASLLNDYAQMLERTRALDEAMALYPEALDITRRVHGNSHSQTSNILSNMAENRRQRGLFEEASTYQAEALAISDRIYTTPHTVHARRLGNMALVEMGLGNPVAAEQLLRKAVTIRESLYSHDDPQVATSLSNLSPVLVAQDKWDEAAVVIRRAIAAFEKADGDWRWQAAHARQNLSRIIREMGELDESETQARTALQLFSEVRGEDHPDTLHSRAALANAILARGRLEEAKTLLVEVLGDSLRHLPETHANLAERHLNLADALVAMNDLEGARPLYDEAVRRGTQTLGPHHWVLSSARLGLAEVLAANGDEAGCAEVMTQLSDTLNQPSLGQRARDRAAAVRCGQHVSG